MLKALKRGSLTIQRCRYLLCANRMLLGKLIGLGGGGQEQSHSAGGGGQQESH